MGHLYRLHRFSTHLIGYSGTRSVSAFCKMPFIIEACATASEAVNQAEFESIVVYGSHSHR